MGKAAHWRKSLLIGGTVVCVALAFLILIWPTGTRLPLGSVLSASQRIRILTFLEIPHVTSYVSMKVGLVEDKHEDPILSVRLDGSAERFLQELDLVETSRAATINEHIRTRGPGREMLSWWDVRDAGPRDSILWTKGLTGKPVAILRRGKNTDSLYLQWQGAVLPADIRAFMYEYMINEQGWFPSQAGPEYFKQWTVDLSAQISH